MKYFNILWIRATIIRSIKTIVQCFLAMYLMSSIVGGISIVYIVCSSLAAGVYSIFLSSFGIPEASIDGTFNIDTHNPEKDIYRLDLDGDLDNLQKKKIIVLSINPKADLSQK